ncbi:hypothetical protein KQI63_16245 [bacterium]|nr:hypothetical protein [bacterium]
MNGGRLVIAIDAGATATKGVLLGRDGRHAATVEGAGYNLRGSNILKFRDIVVTMIRDLFREADLMGHLPNAIALGVAGAGSEDDRKMIREVLEARFPNVMILVHHDAFIAHYGAFRGEPGVLVTSGTGSIAFGKNEAGEEARAGGWGWMLGDEGSGWWVGRECVRAALAEWEGSGPETALTKLVNEHFQLEQAYDFIPLFYSEKISRAQVAELAEAVVNIAKEGNDPVAERIVHVAGRQLGNLAVRAATSLRIPARQMTVALLGSVALGGGELISKGVNEVLKEFLADAPDEKGQPLEVEASTLPEMPIYPPKDLTLGSGDGPTLITAHGNAVDGALLWAQDSMTRRRFA